MENQSQNQKLNELINKAKEILKETKNIAVPQAWNILQLAVAECVQAAQNNYPNLAGSDKKLIVMNTLSMFYDSVFTIITIPVVPSFLQPIIQKYVKQLLMLLVSSSIDAMVTTFKQIGVFNNNTQTTP